MGWRGWNRAGLASLGRDGRIICVSRGIHTLSKGVVKAALCYLRIVGVVRVAEIYLAVLHV